MGWGIPLLVVVGLANALFIVGLLAQAAMAALCSMDVERVSIGFGPPLWRGRRLQITCLPIGGFIRVAGLHPTERPVGNADPRAFFNRPLRARLAYMLGWPLGALAFLAAYGGATAMVFGVEVAQPGAAIARVMPNSPAEAAGLLVDDELLTESGMEVDPSTLREKVRSSEGRPLRFEVLRRGERMKAVLAPVQENGTWLLGVSLVPRSAVLPVGFPEALSIGVRRPLHQWSQILSGVTTLLRGTEKAELMGPVAVATMVPHGSARTAADFIGLLGAYVVLLSLAPFLPFAGGRFVAVLLGWRSRRRRATAEARDVGVAAVPRGRFPAPLLAGLLPLLAAAAAALITVEDPVLTHAMWIVGAVHLAAALVLAVGYPRAWIVAVSAPLLNLKAAVAASGDTWDRMIAVAVCLVVPATLLLPPVRRWFGMRCPVCERLAARPVWTSPRRSCLACGSVFTPGRSS